MLKFVYTTTDGIRKYILGFFICVCLISIDSNLKPYLIKLLIDSFYIKETQYLYISLFILSQLTMVICYSLNDLMGTKFHSEYRRRIPHIFLDKITKYEYKFFQDNMPGTIVAKITDAFNFIFPLIFNSINIFGKFIITTAISLATLFTINPVFTYLLCGWIIFYMFFSYIFFHKSFVYNKVYAPIRPKLYGQISDYITNILSVLMYGRESFEKENLNKITDEFKQEATRYGEFLYKSYFLQGLSVCIYMSCCLFYLNDLKLKGAITAGDFALVFMISYKIGDMLFSIAESILGFSQNYGSALNAIQLLDKEICHQGEISDVKITNTNIKLQNIEFSYQNILSFSLNGELNIKEKQKVGLVGYSGSGKSTFVNLILKLYPLNFGKIFIGDSEINGLSSQVVRQSIAMIPQDPVLFHRSLMDNIRYGRIDATDEEVINAAKCAHAHEFISTLPEGYNSLVGERGIKLSGGQRQRIAIARAILKNAPILILDEATSALDSVTENLIQESLKELMQNKTTIVIAHRLSTLLNMDRILVFEKGKIVEDGTHSELMLKSGSYKKLWDAQVGEFLVEK
jgi:ATP-binding cassette subfamily B protein